MQIKTLHITNSWHPTSGGIATFYRALMKAANSRGQQIRLVVPGEGNHVENIGDFAKIYHVKAPRAPFNSQYRVIYPRQFLAPGAVLQEILAAERPEVVEICDKYTLSYLGPLIRRGLLRKLDFRPVVVGLSCERMDDNVRAYLGRIPLSRDFCAAYIKWLYFPFFDHHIANSDYTAKELRNAARSHVTSRNIWIQPMGVDLTHFSPARRSAEARRALRRNCGGDENSVLIVYSGRIVPEKNLLLLFHVFARLVRDGKRDCRLLIVGDGIERPKWEAFCATHFPGRASFMGHVQNPETLASILANADAFVHPNHREPFGIAPLEAMASGLPVVVPNRGGVTAYANVENAWTAAPDPDSFLAAIESLLSNEAETTRRAQNAMCTAAGFSWTKIAASFLDLYSELHRAFPANRVLEPPVSSTLARGLKIAFSHSVSEAAERIFRLAFMK
jgi:alpha-1,6-mannosyltransferase